MLTKVELTVGNDIEDVKSDLSLSVFSPYIFSYTTITAPFLIIITEANLNEIIM